MSVPPGAGFVCRGDCQSVYTALTIALLNIRACPICFGALSRIGWGEYILTNGDNYEEEPVDPIAVLCGYAAPVGDGINGRARFRLYQSDTRRSGHAKTNE